LKLLGLVLLLDSTTLHIQSATRFSGPYQRRWRRYPWAHRKLHQFSYRM